MAHAEALLAEAERYRNGKAFDHSNLIGAVEEWRRAHYLTRRGVKVLELPQDGYRPDFDLQYEPMEGYAVTEEVKADTYTDGSGRAGRLFVECGEGWNGSTPKPWQDEALRRSGLFSTQADIYTISRTPLR